MSIYAVHSSNPLPLESVREFLKNLLENGLTDAVLVAARSPYSNLPMPTLFTDSDKLTAADPLAPVAPLNMARQAVNLLKHPTGKKVAVVLRPCEIRAFVELVKLNQGTLENALLIGLDCAGRIENDEYLKMIDANPDTAPFSVTDKAVAEKLTTTCRTCTQNVPRGVDIVICRFGLPEKSIGFLASSEQGALIVEKLSLKQTDPPEEREIRIEQIIKERKAAQEQLFKDTKRIISPLQAFQQTVSNCINCYNCRTACPVCYCKECVFLTDVFLHPPEVLLSRAKKRGTLKMPADTTMFHMTRLTHIAHACVGCGQCSSVCPSKIPVADIFRTVAAEVQALYEYSPGDDISQKIPYLAYKGN